jgi:hypothetical protein
LLSGAGAALAVVALEACGSHANAVDTPASVTTREIGVLIGLLHLEYKTIAAYEAGIPLLPAGLSKVPQQFLRHELSHAGELEGLIKKAGTKAPKPRADYALGHPRTETEVLELLHALEAEQLAAYLKAIPQLTEGPVRSGVGAVFANDAQHLSMLRSLLHRPPAPAAFVTGRE